VTLKKELSLLIDTTIWNKILQEIRTNEKNINNNINTINIEMKLRKEEINKNEIFVKKYENDLLLLDNELNLLMETYNVTFNNNDVGDNNLNNSDSSGSNISNGDSKNANQVISDINEITTKITKYEIKKQEIQSKRHELKKEILEPLRKLVRINDVKDNENNKVMIDIEDKIVKLKESIAELSSEKEQQRYIMKSIEQKLKKLDTQLNQTNNVIIDLSNLLCYNNNNASKSFSFHDGVVDVDNYRRIYEDSLSEITKLDVSIKQTNLSLSRLNNMVQIIDEVNDHTCLSSSLHPSKSSSLPSSSSSSSLSNTSSLNSSSSSDYTCSTCGQDMPAESKEQRSNYLQHQLHHLNHEKQHHLNRLSQNKLNYDNSIILKTSKEKKETIKLQIDELNYEYNNSNIKYNKLLEDINIKNITFTNVKNKKIKYDNEKLIIYNKNIKELDENESYDNHLAMEERKIQIDIDKYKNEKEKKLKLYNNIILSISKLQENNIEIKNNIKYHRNIINDYQQIIDKNDNLYQQLKNQLLIYEILSNIFGAKGIQNYIFSHIIKQLESISNAYLSVLADSGIQLSFHNDGASSSSSSSSSSSNNNDMIDRVIKSVYIRSKIDGNYRERSLSQLSGGQWRRVSLSLDLAFAELVRRRGLLRSNLIVMDEVLTHLDASGREAVGTVLRAMVSNDNDDDDDDNDIDGEYDNDKKHDGKNNIHQTSQSKKINYLNDWLFSGGSYETVIVILQDLAAAELEEAFDHIDIVVKESDSSSVLIEGMIM
jgi:DNA repair exonuclease SbcCD ATPase subunit